MNKKEMAMDGVGNKLIEALRRECTSGAPDRYALKRLAALIDELYETDAAPVIGRAYHRALEVTERRKRMAVVE